ncbi:UNVERIFIED_ORG: hypothetical protein E4P37_00870 [Bacillus sp. AZ43]
MSAAAGIGRGIAVAAAGTWLALVEVFWLPLRVGGVLLPVSVVAAVVGNLVLPALALRVSGSRLIAVLPVLGWIVVALAGMVRRPEGDLVVNGVGALGVVGLVFLALGVTAGAFSVGRVLGAGARPPAA